MKKERADRGYLTEDEVLAIALKEINMRRLDNVRDVFIFACYTGLSYADIATLRAENIKKMFDCKLWIVNHSQKTNAYLKEIADLCGIEKNLTFHLARHNFVTTMTLGKGVPIESVSKMLGHTNIQSLHLSPLSLAKLYMV